MKKRREELDQVKKALQSSHKGMTITEISQILGANRNSVAKYLDMLCMAGEVDMRMFGRSKIYSLSDRMPLDIALSLSSELIVIIDETYRIIDVNNRFLQYADVERGGIVGQTLETVRVDILAQPEILLNIKDALRGYEYAKDICITRKNETCYFKFWLKPLTLSDMKSKVAIVYENITARKTAELALKESEARYRAIVEDQAEMICRFSHDTTVIFINRSFCRFFGMKNDQIVGKKLVDLMPVKAKMTLIKDLSGLFKSKEAFTYEHTYPSADGKLRFVQWTANCINKESDKPAEYQTLGRDITDCILAENARKQTEEYFQKVYDMMPVGSCIAATDFRFVKVNHEYCRITGYSEKELMSLSMIEILHKDDIGAVRKRVKDMASGLCDCMQAIKRYVRKDGSIVLVEVKVKIARDQSGKPMYYIEMIEEVSDRIVDNGSQVFTLPDPGKADFKQNVTRAETR